ncbi:hypothetical protein [Cellulosimicrobium sp. SL-1]|uniref:hypothetical protein n=1 Tax=Cellulosimicrobium sp. SL-1 TaxID=2699423 RepID=UPI0013D2889A|nr:hypothetical protein [Cellulosimicrobium sp. SL-1]
MNLLDFLAALLWPAVVVLAVLVFRSPISERIKNLREVSAPGGTGAKFDPTGPQDALANVDPVPAPSPGTDPAPGPGSDADTTQPPAQTPSTDERVSMTRDDLQTLVREFAEAGWEIRSLGGFSTVPTPVVQWNEDTGRPFIAYWQGQTNQDSQAAKSLNAKQHRVKLEDDLRAATALVDEAKARFDRLEADPGVAPDLVKRARMEWVAAIARRESAKARRNDFVHSGARLFGV